MTTENFEKMLKFVLQREGGYVNDPHDLGGETNKGITHNTYNSYRKSKGLQTRSVKYITDDEVRDIYYNNYFKASGADKITNPQLAIYVFDTAVNMGVSRAKKLLEQSNGDPETFEQLRRAKYNEFAKSNPSQQRYLQGWNNRVTAVKNFAKTNFQDSSDSDTTMLKVGIEMNVDQNGNHIYTPQEIGEMSAEEFEKNLPIIEQQLQNGLIKQQVPEVDYSGYINPVNGGGKIYSREDIDKMTSKEYSENESAIMAQMKAIGIPTNKELETSSQKGGTVYVKPYTRSDGTEVRGYYRAI